MQVHFSIRTDTTKIALQFATSIIPESMNVVVRYTLFALREEHPDKCNQNSKEESWGSLQIVARGGPGGQGRGAPSITLSNSHLNVRKERAVHTP